ncbi:MAG: PDZ domain-containing protein [Oscillospiraceae bacterium]|nr:PDZ domain-containing protein [Oscillospiraceae bacterium]
MMKKFQKLMSYLVVAVLSSIMTLAMTQARVEPPSKLDALEDLIDEKFIGECDITALEDAAAAAMIQATGDRWSYYIPADQYAAYVDQMANSYVGIGITIQLEEGKPGFLVTKVNQGGPADQAGMLPGDIVVAVDGVDVREMNIDDTSALVKGQENTTVDITVERAGEELTLTVTRMLVQVPVATAKMLEGNVGLITITNFDTRCADETIAAIDSLLEQGAEKLIFDVRYNPGGYVHELVNVLDYILPEGELFRSVDYLGNESVDSSDKNCIEGVPMAVLINGDSYSAAEFFAAALREYDYALVVGQPTVGKGYFQQNYKLEDGSAVNLSVGKYFTPKGVSLAEVGGLIPDVPVEVDEDTAMAIYAGTLDPMEDPQILAAIEAMNP